jgi:hypothetical protein
MIREWVGHILKRKKISKQEFLTQFDKIIRNQIERILNKRDMPSIMRDAATEGARPPFEPLPLLGYLAIYSINLILFRLVVGDDPFMFDETWIASEKDRARPWDQLVYLWRSWFAMDYLSRLTPVFAANREQSVISVRAKDTLSMSGGRTQLEMFYNVNLSLGENISSALAGLLRYDVRTSNVTELDEIERRLLSEDIRLPSEIALRRLISNERIVRGDNIGEFVKMVNHAIVMALQSRAYQQLEPIVFSLGRALTRVATRVILIDGEQLCDLPEDVRSALEAFLRQQFVVRIAEVNVDAAQSLVRLARNMNVTNWFEHIPQQVFQRLRFTELSAWCETDHSYDIRCRRHQAAFDWTDFDRTDLRGIVQLLHAIAGDLPPTGSANLIAWLLTEQLLGSDVKDFSTLMPNLLRIYPRFPVQKIVLTKAISLIDILSPDSLVMMAEQNPEEVLDILDRGSQPGGGNFRWDAFARQLLERALGESALLKVAQRSREAAINLAYVVCNIDGIKPDGHITEEFLELVLDSKFLVQQLNRAPMILARAMEIIRVSNSQLGAAILSEALITLLDRPGGERNLLRRLPLQAWVGIEWLARSTTNSRLADTLLRVAAGKGG